MIQNGSETLLADGFKRNRLDKVERVLPFKSHFDI
jgi:hypothetical protein